MNQVLGDEIKQSKDSLNLYRFKLSKSDSTVNVQSLKIDSLQSSIATKNILLIAISLVVFACGYVIRKLKAK